MSDLTISAAASLTGATLATNDLIPVLDVSASAGSKGSRITVAELFTGRAISGGTIAGITALGIRNAGTGAFDLTIAHNGTLTAARTLTFDVGDVAHAIALGTTAGTITFPNAAAVTVAGLQIANAFTAAQTITTTVGASALTLAGGTQTSSFPVLDMAQTWNASGTTFTGVKLNVTSTASAAGSLLMDLQVGSATKLNVDKNGFVTVPGLGATSGFSFGNGNVCLLNESANVMTFYANGQVAFASSGKLVMPSNNFFGWSATASGSVSVTQDTILGRKAAATMQMGLDAAGVTNQMFTAASRITSDGVGANLTLAAGNGRGAAGGSLLLSYYTTAGSGVAGTLTTALTLDTTGLLTHAEGSNVAFGTTTGTKLGTATSQKIGIWNATPIVQPTTAITASTFVANTSLIANDTATWDGYTVGQVVKALRNTGLLA